VGDSAVGRQLAKSFDMLQIIEIQTLRELA
jgi:hypothetical protein